MKNKFEHKVEWQEYQKEKARKRLEHKKRERALFDKDIRYANAASPVEKWS